jgi:hypothetical protein
MSELENQYRRALRWYSGAWRRHNGEALLSTLIDAAEADGRTRALSAERRNLALNGLRERARSSVPFVLFTLAFTSLLIAVGMSASGVSLQSTIILSLPPFPAPGVGEFYSTPSTGGFSAVWLYASCAALCAAASTLGALSFRRNRRVLRGEAPELGPE